MAAIPKARHPKGVGLFYKATNTPRDRVSPGTVGFNSYGSREGWWMHGAAENCRALERRSVLTWTDIVVSFWLGERYLFRRPRACGAASQRARCVGQVLAGEPWPRSSPRRADEEFDQATMRPAGGALRGGEYRELRCTLYISSGGAHRPCCLSLRGSRRRLWAPGCRWPTALRRRGPARGALP
jgi:hypothetical protein